MRVCVLVLVAYEDEEGPLVERIMDKAGQKGTGKWTAINSLELGMPVTLIGESGKWCDGGIDWRDSGILCTWP